MKYPFPWTFLLTLIAAPCVLGGTPDTPTTMERMRPGIAAGMGVEYLSPRDIVDMINSAGFHPRERQPEFHAGVNFFGAGFVPLTGDWMLKVEYAYVLNTYNIDSQFGPGEFTMKAHLPTIILHYIFVDEGLYNLSAGAGMGYHFGELSVSYSTLVDSYTATGPGGLLELQGNTAIGEDLFVHLGVQARWEGIGELRNGIAGAAPGINAQGDPARMGWFSVGARIGMSYYF
jgi:hypothetical protein